MRFALAFLLVATSVLAQECEDLTAVDGSPWHDSGGEQYNCADWYKGSKKCNKDGGAESMRWQGMVANEACCKCGGGSTGSFALAGGSAVADAVCTPDPTWSHPKYGDTCEDYKKGGKSYKYRCKDDKAMKNCCSCEKEGTADEKPEEVVDPSCQDVRPGGELWHDDGGSKYTCEYYQTKKRCATDGDKYIGLGGLYAKDACCACGGGGKTCSDMSGPDGLWHDSGSVDYNCAYYGAKKKRCKQFGDQYPDEWGLTANQACCVCGGGQKEGQDGVEAAGKPEPDKGDDISSEWMGDTKFKHKKHLRGGFILYWNTDVAEQTVTFGLLSPEGAQDQWIALGLSPNGGMAGSDAVVAWFEGNTAKITDYFFMNQSPSGIRALGRQSIYNEKLFRYDSRIGLIFSRPWVSSKDGIEIQAQTDFALLILARGEISSKCKPFCNHQPDDRFTAEIALTAPPGMTVYELNRQTKGEPCNGPARLECLEGSTCYNEFAPDGDFFAPDFEQYGECVDRESIGDESDRVDSDNNWQGVQTVYSNNGGFEKEKRLRGGFVLLWTVNKLSPEGSFGPDDTISLAFISTASDHQGWIGFGWSPNGEMKGSDVVIGWKDGENEHIGDYFLEAQVASKNKEANRQELVNARVIKKNGQTAIAFERKLTPADSVQLLEGDIHIIYADGPIPDEDDKEYIPYHRYRRNELVEFIPLAESIADKVNAGEREYCAGPADIKCQKQFTCTLFTESMIDRWKERAGQPRPQFNITGNSTFGGGRGGGGRGGGGRGGGGDRWRGEGGNRSSYSNRLNPWTMNQTELDNLLGQGMCLKTEDSERFESMSESINVQREPLVKPEEWDNHYKLRWGFDLYWKMLDEDNIRILLLASSQRGGWIGLGMGTDGMMLGANAVIGWHDDDDASNTRIEEYSLDDKLPWEIKPVSTSLRPSMEATNMIVKHEGRENYIQFDRPLKPSSGFAPIEPGKMWILFAVGNVPLPNDDYFGYHRFRDAQVVELISARD